jgi:hypothetical protein
MYTGTLMDELMASVERAEERTMQAQSAETIEFEAWLAVAGRETTQIETNLLGVA